LIINSKLAPHRRKLQRLAGFAFDLYQPQIINNTSPPSGIVAALITVVEV
jgi:hypothetical protein